jgi:UDP-N-acetylmuramate--alanine ligase
VTLSGSVHLVGIGGVGMSALAQAYLDAGWIVSGADRSLRDGGAPTPVLSALASQGVRLFPDDGSGIGENTGRLVISTAIEETNQDLHAARARGIPVVHRAAALSELLSDRKLVAVAGTCGKSTVTAMLGHLLAACGFDPLVVNGAQIVGWDADGTRVGSVRRGGGEWAVAEVDESDKSLTAFRPYAAIVTNASADHYSKEEMDEVFDAFVRDVPGPVIDGRVIFKASKEFKDVNAPNCLNDLNDLKDIAARCPLPGEHNRANAMLALRMAEALGAPRERLGDALAAFLGVERRLQRVGSVQCGDRQVAVFDDYAHNPEKLHAMLTTLQAAYPQGVAIVWRPHGYAPLRKMLAALAAMFRETMRPQDLLVLPPVYDAGGTADRSVNSDALAALLADAQGNVVLASDLKEAEAILRTHAPAVGAIVTAGARDPGLPVLARRLIQQGTE